MHKFETETVIESIIYLQNTEEQLLDMWDDENDDNYLIDNLLVYNRDTQDMLIELVETNVKTKAPRTYFKDYGKYEKFVSDVYSGKYSPEEVIDIYDSLTLKENN
ncbi:hypothetical protein [Bacillus infantis]|uniref:hypothetical protein n=1 Tax=Bacillus infantis TaxID=324767 RepID=UPI00209ED833|nr:hypothetical protein [Bacillus infantis]MCP1159407.1 hypothetical protein [Bacillus infantis]